MEIIISLLILCTYLLYVCFKFNVIPVSISNTYYIIKWKPLFTLIISISALLTLPRGMDVASEKSDILLVPFLAVFGSLLVAVAPKVKDYEKTIHMVGAGISGIFSQIWVLLYGNIYTLLLLIIPLILGIISLIKYKEGNLEERLDKLCFVFWTEIICLGTFYINLIQTI